MSIFSSVVDLFSGSEQIGLDIGSCHIRISISGGNKVISEPAVVAKNVRSDRIVAIGEEAKKITGRTPPHIQTVWPVVAGEVEDSAALEALLSMLLYRETRAGGQLFGRSILVALPAGITDVSLRIIEKTLQQARARTVTVVPAAVAALVGVGAPVGDPTGQAVLNLGCGLSQAAAVSGGTVVAEATTTIAGSQFDERIKGFVAGEYGVHISNGQARRIKHTLAAVRGWSDEPGESLSVSGQDEAGNLPREITLTRIDVAEALEPLVDDLTDFAHDFVGSLSADMAADLSAHGLYMVGETAKLPGLAEHFSDELGLTVHTRVAPETTVIEGVSYIANREDSARFSKPITAYETQ